MARFGFIGGSYSGRSPAETQRSVNWYPESVETGEGESLMVLQSTPGLALFGAAPETPHRGAMEINGRVFAVVGAGLYEVLANGGYTFMGAVANDGNPASLAASSTQVLVCAGLKAYLLTLGTNAFAEVTGALAAPQAPVQCGFTDTYFVVMHDGSNKFQFSAPLDGATWPGTSVGAVSVFAENLVGMTVEHREVVLHGGKRSVAYYDSGNLFPFDVVPGGFLEHGCGARWSPTRLDNTEFWLGQDERGALMAWRMQGYSPQRISNHAIENEWQGYQTGSDAEGYAYQANGHTFWVLRFPTADKTWVYDVATGQWHERAFWDGAHGVYKAHRSRWHVYAFGRHLVGDPLSGSIYRMDETLYDDFGNVVRRLRHSPVIGEEFDWIFHQQLVIDMETGLANLAGAGSDPVVAIRFSDDRGKTWSNEIDLKAGQIGEYARRVVVRRLGRSRAGRVYEMVATDPIAWRIVDAYLEATGMPPQERLAHKFRQSA